MRMRYPPALRFYIFFGLVWFCVGLVWVKSIRIVRVRLRLCFAFLIFGIVLIEWLIYWFVYGGKVLHSKAWHGVVWCEVG